MSKPVLITVYLQIFRDMTFIDEINDAISGDIYQLYVDDNGNFITQ